MHQKYTIELSSNTKSVFIATLKIEGFSIGFSSYIQDNIQ